MHLNGLDQTQILNLLRQLPGVFNKVSLPDLYVSALLPLATLFSVDDNGRTVKGLLTHIYGQGAN